MAADISITIENRPVGPGYPVFIIAEIGINHGGDATLAGRMIDRAVEAGADAVKFQTVDVTESYLPDTLSYREFRDKSLSLAEMRDLNAQARARGVVPLSTPGGFRALEFMLESDIRAVKISSGQMTNIPLIRSAASTGLPLIISTGMAEESEVRMAVEAAQKGGSSAIALLQCTSLYPAQPETLHLRAIAHLAATFDVPVGYSDHSLGSLACVAAVAAGACILEKHFTLDPDAPGADHAISADPAGFAEMVGQVRTVETMLGEPAKRPQGAEAALRAERHRFLVAARDIAPGEQLAASDVLLMRVSPGAGKMPATDYDRVVGARARGAIATGTPLDPELLDAAE